jgi:hypothetical protein
MRKTPSFSLSDRMVAALFFLVGGTVMYLLRTIRFSIDSLWYATQIREWDGHFHPHHLIYVPLNHKLHQLSVGLFGSSDALIVAQLHNIVFGAMGVSVFYLLARSLTPHRWLAAAGAACLLLSSGWWGFSTQIEVYVPSATCLLLLIADVHLHPQRAMQWGRGLLHAVLLALAILYHQTSILFCLPLVLWLVQQLGRRGLLQAMYVIGCAGSLCMATYAWAMAISGVGMNYAGITGFIFQYAAAEQPGWGDWHHFGPVGLFQLLRSQVSMIFRQRLASLAFWVILFLLILVWIILGNLYTQYKSRRDDPVQDFHRPLRGMLLSWLGISYLFFLWWLPTEVEFFIISLVPVFLLTVMGGTRWLDNAPAQRWRRWGIPALLALVLGTNATMIVNSHFDKNDMALDAEALHAAAGSDCAIYTDSATEQFVQYYNQREAHNATFLLMHYYDGRPYVVLTDPKALSCYVIEMRFLLPSCKAEMGMTAYDHPRAWRQYMQDLLKVEQADSSKALTTAELIVLPMQADRLMLRVSTREKAMHFPNWEAIWAKLDEMLVANGQGDKAEFVKWFQTAGKTLE